jgi:hypothetical protein
MFEDFAHGVILCEIDGIKPHTLPHQEREISAPLPTLDAKAFKQLRLHKVHLIVEASKEVFNA